MYYPAVIERDFEPIYMVGFLYSMQRSIKKLSYPSCKIIIENQVILLLTKKILVLFLA